MGCNEWSWQRVGAIEHKSAEKVWESAVFEKSTNVWVEHYVHGSGSWHQHCGIMKSTPGGAQTGMQSHHQLQNYADGMHGSKDMLHGFHNI